MKHIHTFERFINEANSVEFYNSNTDKKVTPKEKGWYISFRTKSGDQGFIKADRQPKDNKDALEILKKLNPHEVYANIIKIAEIK
jgi:hypothetical protein